MWEDRADEGKTESCKPEAEEKKIEERSGASRGQRRKTLEEDEVRQRERVFERVLREWSERKSRRLQKKEP